VTSLYAIGLVILGTLIGTFGAICLKKGSKELSLQPLKLIQNYYLIGGCALYGLSTVPFILALQHGDVSVLYPVTSLANVWVCMLSPKLLGEKMNITKWIGIALIINGVIAISW
jgi:uncharacterized membrane protein|tara:strand:- start:252 stop:593 length:342 start_codon:yes stop_codon:yes gene_type:complete